jgi:hypothetical protein
VGAVVLLFMDIQVVEGQAVSKLTAHQLGGVYILLYSQAHCSPARRSV